MEPGRHTAPLLHYMRFCQQHTINEYGEGDITVRFVLTDTYSELFTAQVTDEPYTDIFLLESVKKDLNTKDDKFAVDELSFSVDELSCRTEHDRNALAFLNQAMDYLANRFVAIFILTPHDSTPSVDNMEFIGKVKTDVSGEDKLHSNTPWSSDFTPVRSYKYSAQSFDLSMLDKIKIYGMITKPDNTNIVGLFGDENFENPRITKDDLDAIFQHRKSYDDTVKNSTWYTGKVASLKDILVLLMKKGSDILGELTGTPITIEMEESDLGMTGIPVDWAITKTDKIYGGEIVETGLEVRQSSISSILSDETIGFDSTMFELKPQLMDYDAYYTLTKTAKEMNRAYNILSKSSLTDVLTSIARSLCCYVLCTYSAGNIIKFKFASRKALYNESEIFLIGASAGSINISSQVEDSGHTYYCTANDFMSDKGDNDEGMQTSKRFDQDVKDREQEKKDKNTEFEKALFSLSYPIVTAHVKGEYWNYYNSVPLNRYVVHNGGFEANRRCGLHSGIYMNFLSGGTSYWRPVSRILVNINGSNVYFDSLADYLNTVSDIHKQYYLTEYELTVPFWSGFSPVGSAVSAHWTNMKLMKKLRLQERVRVCNDGVWSDQIKEFTYQIIGYERKLDKPEIKLKLSNISTLSFGNWQGGAPTAGIIRSYEGGIELATDRVEQRVVATGAEVGAGCAVQLLSDGTIINSSSLLSGRVGQTIGIAVESGVGGETILIQLSGRVNLPNVLAFTRIGAKAYVRSNSANTHLCNISETTIDTTVENNLIFVGDIIGENTISINIREIQLCS